MREALALITAPMLQLLSRKLPQSVGKSGEACPPQPRAVASRTEFALSEDDAELVRWALAPGNGVDVLVKGPRGPLLLRQDAHSCGPGEAVPVQHAILALSNVYLLAGVYVNDEIINGYLALCLKEHPDCNVHVFSTFFWTRMISVRCSMHAGHEISMDETRLTTFAGFAGERQLHRGRWVSVLVR